MMAEQNHRMMTAMDNVFPAIRMALALSLATISTAAAAQQRPAAVQPELYAYADVADHAVNAATIVDARIRRVREVEPARATGVAPGHVRFYLEGDVQGLLFGRDPVARRISWLVDLPRDARGRPPSIARGRVLLFARPVQVANQLVLVSPNAMIPWDMAVDTHARSIAAELARGAAPPSVLGVSQAFHTPGTVPGESETQIFLRTSNGNPISLSILRRPGQRPSWVAAFGEIVDEGAGQPRPGTLAHYRLSCGLSNALPDAALTTMSQTDAATTRADYAIVRDAVGPCRRGTIATPPPAVPPAPVR
jgi:hypothetical protein